MSINIQTLTELVDESEFKLVAGERGITNVIRWVHMVENIEIASFIEGGEMIFITGVCLENEKSVLELVQFVGEQGACAVVINVGPYIDEISQELIDYCNETNLPLFEVPWHIYMVEIMKQFCLAIGDSQKVQRKLSSIVEEIIFKNNQDRSTFAALEGYGFKANMDYIVSIIEFNVINNDIEFLRDKIHLFLSKLHTELITVEAENRLLLLYGKCSEGKIKEQLEQLLEWYKKIEIGPQIRMIGIGQKVKSLKEISKSYEEANKCLKFQLLLQDKESVLLYSNLGVYKLALAIEDQNVISEFYEEALMPLIQYDKSKDADLMLVLQYYIESSGSIKNVSEKMFVHRNTVNYKLKRIEEILACDLSDWNTRVTLSMALILNKMR